MRRGIRQLGTALLAAALGVTPAGCYEHVVGTRGTVRGDLEVYEPNVPKEPGPMENLESAMWGDKPARKSWREKQENWRDR